MSTSYDAAFIATQFAPSTRARVERALKRALIEFAGITNGVVTWSRGPAVVAGSMRDEVMSSGTDTEGITDDLVAAVAAEGATLEVVWLISESRDEFDDSVGAAIAQHAADFEPANDAVAEGLERFESPGKRVLARQGDRLLLEGDSAAVVVDLVTREVRELPGVTVVAADTAADGALAMLVCTAPGERPRLAYGSLAENSIVNSAACALAFDATAVRALGGLGALVAANDALAWADDGAAFGPTPKHDGFDARAFVDGSALVVVGGQAYRVASRSQLTALPIPPFSPEEPSNAPAASLSDDGRGVVLLADRKLLVVRADGTFERPFPTLDNITSVGRGPAGTLLVCEGEHLEDDVAKVLWLATGEVTEIPRTFVQLPGGATFVAFVAATRTLWLQFMRDVRIVPWAVIEALPRSTPG